MRKRKKNPTPWMLWTVLCALLATAAVLGVLHSQGIHQILPTRGGIVVIRVRVASPREAALGSRRVSYACGKTAWGTGFSRIRWIHKRGSFNVEEVCEYYLFK